MKMLVPIRKVVESDDGTCECWGVAAEERTDRAKEKFDYARSKPHFVEWSNETLAHTKKIHGDNEEGYSLGNVRAMHGKVAAGKLIAINFNDADKQIEIGAKIIDPVEVKKVRSGTYRAFSIGGSYLDRWPDLEEKGITRYEAEPHEISVVDRGAMINSNFTAIKADGTSELRKFISAKESATVSAPAPLAKSSDEVKCPECGVMVEPDDNDECPECGADLSEEEAEKCASPGCGLTEAEHLAKGDVVGHEFHGDQYTGGTHDTAERASTRAQKETERATTTYGGTRAAHASAANMHHKAAVARMKAAWDSKPGSKENESHSKDVEHHMKMYAVHMNYAKSPTEKSEGAHMTPETLTKISDRFLQLAKDRGVTLTAPATLEKVGFQPDQYAWQGSLKTRQALEALYIIALLDALISGEEREEENETEQTDLLSEARTLVARFIPAELAEDEPEAAGVPGAMAMADSGDLEKALSERIKAHFNKGNAQEAHDHLVKEFGAKCAKAEKAEIAAEGVEKAEPAATTLPAPELAKSEPLAVGATPSADTETLNKAVGEAVTAAMQKFETERAGEREAMAKERETLHTQVETLTGQVASMSKRVVEKDGTPRQINKSGDTPSTPQPETAVDSAALVKSVIDEIRTQVGPEKFTPEMAERIGMSLALRVLEQSKR